MVTFQVDRVYTEGQHFRDYTGFMTRAADYLPTRTGPGVGTPAPDRLEEIAVDAVSLGYPDRDTAAVDQVTPTIEAGQTVAFVGENDSGKSTLSTMIASLRAPTGRHHPLQRPHGRRLGHRCATSPDRGG